MNAFRAYLEGSKTAVFPGVYDALTARIAERFGFPGISVGGYDVGAVTAVTEPLLTMTEMLDAARRIKRAVKVPMIVDVGAGFGEPMHVVRMMEDVREARIEAVHLEDQIYPKRAHYFKDYREHTVSLEEFVDKIRWAKTAGGDEVVVIARTDTFKTEGAVEAVRRARAALEAGADGVLAFPNSMEEAAAFPREVPGPVIYVNTHGNRVGRPRLTQDDAQRMGYRILIETHVFLFAAFDAMTAIAKTHAGDRPFEVADAIETRRRVEEILKVQKLVDIESATVEGRSGGH